MFSQLPLYLQIYDRIVKDIFNGVYQPGDKLPSKTVLSQQYDVGEGTIKLAVKQLREAGFIRTAKRKAAVIIFDIDDPATHEKLEILYRKRQKHVMDRLTVFSLFVPSALSTGAAYCSEQEIRSFRSQVNLLSLSLEATTEFREQVTNIYVGLLKKTGSDILLFFFNETSPFSVIPSPSVQSDPFFPVRKRVLAYTQTVIGLMEAGKICQIAQEQPGLTPIIENAQGGFLQYLSPVAFTDEDKTNLFHNEYLYMEVLGQIVKNILLGKYKEGELLPTEAEMEKICSVSRITVRTAYRLLGKIGITETVQGRGTRVLTCEERVRRKNEPDESVIENLRQYFDALLAVIIPSKAIARYAGQCADAQDTAELWQLLNTQPSDLATRNIFPAMLVIDFITRQTGNAVLRIFGQFLTDLLYWGFYFEGIVDAYFLHDKRENRELCLNSVRALMVGDVEKFSSLLEAFFISLYHLSRKSCFLISPELGNAVAPPRDPIINFE